MTTSNIVIVGGGHAAAQLCISLVDAGCNSQISLISEEAVLPYQRPPLSKSFLKNPAETVQLLRGESWYREHGIRLMLGSQVVAIDRASKGVELADGSRLDYNQLVLATGARARSFPGIPPGTVNAFGLRGMDDAQLLQTMMAEPQDILVLGGGFIGLEFAATAAAKSHRVVLLESAPRLMARAVSPQLSEYALQVHRSLGIEIHLQALSGLPVIERQRFVGLDINGKFMKFSGVLSAVGAMPNQEIASHCGLICDNGVLVDEQMRTSDPSILAIGDCARFALSNKPWLPKTVRLESIQNANDQAKTAASTLMGQTQPYHSLPWFWSEQGPARFQMAGLLPSMISKTEVVQGSSPGAQSWYHFDGDGELACVESVNFPADHMKAKKQLNATW
jgi:3-phenylpropionate/trans-cinnamate dioxygenase ferredoxin reductase subunit